MSLFKWLLAIAMIWALAPWLFLALYQVHQPDHADAVWLVAMPFMFASFIPMFLGGGDTGQATWFPIGWVIASSTFNLVIGVLISCVVKFAKRKTLDS